MEQLILAIKVVVFLQIVPTIAPYPRSRDNFQYQFTRNRNELVETRHQNFITASDNLVEEPSSRILPPERPNIYTNGGVNSYGEPIPIDSQRQTFPIVTKFPPENNNFVSDPLDASSEEKDRLAQMRKESRLSLADWGNYNIREPNGPGTYAWGYDIEDADSGNVQFRSEEKHRNGSVTGSYGYLEPDGNVHVVHYIADNQGYRATVENSRYKTAMHTSPLAPSFDAFDNHVSPEFAAALESQQRLDANGRPQGEVLEQHYRPIDLQKPPATTYSQNRNLGQYNYYFIPKTASYN